MLITLVVVALVQKVPLLLHQAVLVVAEMVEWKIVIMLVMEMQILAEAAEAAVDMNKVALEVQALLFFEC
jgi:uncharacterized membrane protein